ncbi:type II toxin-antitoxin system RelE/ParE family toxin [Haloferula sp. BvORR071]|uniref:type II toxin-antitoxin system RelE/ParE family toxin n=1 Tax=Haloferula sp. BvORR071 TaxID=1396141 RepID=UPI00055194AB|nr:type II toxin-antitoxin system RelE/ParE family toxin [Haloferula sp. BvORR071]
MTLDLTKAAVEDLRSIRNYTFETWGEHQEAAYLKAMWARFREIQGNPARFRRRDDLFPGCRIAAEGRHVILFRENGEVLEIVRILHSAMDFKRHLPPS